MWQNVKTYLIEVGIKKVVPIVIRGAVALAAAKLSAPSLAKWGINVDWSKLQGELTVAALAGVEILWHHIKAWYMGQSHSGAIS